MTKKAAALLLAASLAVSMCATPVFAASNESSNNGGTAPNATEVTYRVDSSYTWSIPAKIDFGANAGIKKTRTVAADQDKDAESTEATNTVDGTAPKVCVTENIIASGKTLKISIDTAASGVTYDTTDNKFYVKNDENVKLYFTINKPFIGSISNKILDSTNSEVLKVSSGKNTDGQTLYFELKTEDLLEAEAAGTYNGKVAFKSEVGNFY